MRKIVLRMAAGTLLILIALAPMGPVAGRLLSLPPVCQELAFSTEEDFVSQGPNQPYISDGDLLSIGQGQCIICARNHELLQAFDIDPQFDLGLDAADVIDVIDVEPPLIAFSTELNSTNPGQFTHGDLLVTMNPPLIIRNQALTFAFEQGAVGYDIGLDAVHFVGKLEPILAFLKAAQPLSPITPEELTSLFRDFPTIDIWFSTEGTWTLPGTPLGFLDGDLLSARDGKVVLSNADLLHPDVPAGIPDRGVDFGLDAATADRGGYLGIIHFSTEILFDGELAFTDGDVLKVGNGVVHTNSELVKCYEPMAEFLGLDALHLALEVLPAEIQGKKFHDLDADRTADPGEPGLGEWEIHLDGLDNPHTDVKWTNATGVYSFTVPPGLYKVSEVCPAGAGWHQSRPAPIDDVCGTGVYSLTVASGDPPHLGVDFGNYLRVTKSGYKFEDQNNNGNWDLDLQEPPLPQWEIHLDGRDGMNQDVNEVTLTDRTGYYSFTVPPGDYVVRELCQPGYAQTKPEPTDGCGSGIYEFKPISGDEPHTGNDFGNFAGIGIHLPVILKDYP